MKKAGKRIGIIILVILLIVAAYLVYVMVSYHRLPDKLTLEVNRTGNQGAFEEDRQVEVGKYYWIMTYNIGFGAYRNDYSFFMDGGRSSWAKDEESVTAGICGMGDIVNTVNPDFVLLQEVDIDGTRSYHVNELELMNQFVTGYYYTFAENYDSPFLLFPPWEPHGANQAGIVTYSRIEITDTMRRSLPSPSAGSWIWTDAIPFQGSLWKTERASVFIMYIFLHTGQMLPSGTDSLPCSTRI